jgi:hypothetical protein
MKLNQAHVRLQRKRGSNVAIEESTNQVSMPPRFHTPFESDGIPAATPVSMLQNDSQLPPDNDADVLQASFNVGVGLESASLIPEIRLDVTPNIGSPDQGRITPPVSQSALRTQINNAAGIQSALFDEASPGGKTELALRVEEVPQPPDVAVQFSPDNDLPQPVQSRRQDLLVPGEEGESGVADDEESPEKALEAQFMALRNRFTKQKGAGPRPNAAQPASMQHSTNATSNAASSTLPVSQTRPTPRFMNTLMDPDPVEEPPSDRLVWPSIGSDARRVDALSPSQPSSNAESFIRKSSQFVSQVSPNEGLQQPRSVASPTLLADPDDLMSEEDQPLPMPRFPNTASSKLDSTPSLAGNFFSDRLVWPSIRSDARRVDALSPSQPSSNAESFIRKSSQFVSQVSPNEGLQQPRSVASPTLLADPDDTGDFDILSLGRSLFRQ